MKHICVFLHLVMCAVIAVGGISASAADGVTDEMIGADLPQMYQKMQQEIEQDPLRYAGMTQEEIEFAKEFEETPLWERSSSEMIYPASMRTLFSDGRTEPVQPEEYEQYMTTELAPWLKIYHMTTEQQVYQGIKGGEWGQLVFSIACSPFDPNLVLMGNDTCGIYRSEDGGKSWKHSSEGLLSYMVPTILFDPDDENVVYAITAGGTNKGRFGCVGVHKSEDKGNSWRMVLPLSNVKRVADLLVFGPKDAQGNRVLYAACDDITAVDTTGKGYTGLWRSFDRGETWECMGFEDKQIVNLEMDEASNSLLVCAEGQGLVMSRDNGETWQEVNNGLPAIVGSVGDASATTATSTVHGLVMAENEIVDVAIDPADNTHWFTGTYSMRLFESFDSGASWQEVQMDLGQPQVSDTAFLRKLYFGAAKDGQPTRLFFDMYNTVETLRYSDDNGRTFQIPDYHQEMAFFLKPWHTGWFTEAMAFSPHNPDLVFTGRGSTMRISTDGGANFWPSSSGYSGAAAYDWVFDQNGVLKYLAMTDTGIWRTAEGYEGDYIPIKDAGKARISDVGNGKTATDIAIDPNDPNHAIFTWGAFMYGRQSTLAETFDGFESASIIQPVQELSEQRVAESGDDTDIRANGLVAYHNKKSNVIYATWFRSYDNGKTWLENEYPIRGIDSADNDILYSIYNLQVYVSYDMGNTWCHGGMSIPTSATSRLRAVTADTFRNGVLWVAENTTVYRLDLKNGEMRQFGGENGLTTATGKRLECFSIAMNPKDENHLIICGRDVDTSSWYYNYETYDGGETWTLVPGMPMLSGAQFVKFHPTKQQIYFGSMMGTIVYDYGKRLEMEKSQVGEVAQ